MNRSDVTKAAAVISKQNAIRARQTELKAEPAAMFYLNLSPQRGAGKPLGNPIGFDVGKPVVEFLIHHLQSEIELLDKELSELGVD